MEQLEEVISELVVVTRQMAESGDQEGDGFCKLIRRRGELIQRLCSCRFDPSDDRIASIVLEGAQFQARMESHCDSLRGQIASLDLAAIHVRGVRSTLSQPEQGVDFSA